MDETLEEERGELAMTREAAIYILVRRGDPLQETPTPPKGGSK